MFVSNIMISKELKMKNAEKIKEEKKKWKEEKIQREKEKTELIRKKNKQINELEAAFLQELAKKKVKKEKEKDEKFFWVKTSGIKGLSIRHGNKARYKSSEIDEKINSDSTRRNCETPIKLSTNESFKGLKMRMQVGSKPSEIQTNASENCIFERKSVENIKTQENYSVVPPVQSVAATNFRHASPYKSGESLLSLKTTEYKTQKNLREKRMKKFLPHILKPVGNNVLTIHIVGETKPSKCRSENCSPNRDNVPVHKPYFHMFRDVETEVRTLNVIPESKLKIMQNYDEVVKRNYTPKPDINYKLKLESKKLEKFLQNTVKRVKFLKIF